MRKFLLLVTLLVAIFPAFLEAVAQAPRGPGGGHGFLIDKHIGAGLNCASCHHDAPPPNAPEMAVCLMCHGSYQQIASKTASDQPNPHASHVGEIPCASCHHVHKASEMFCNGCHGFALIPP
jgi:hypothetical protein